MTYDIQLNPYNPVEYLATCGVLEILARFDADALSWWELKGQPRCWLQTRVDEAALQSEIRVDEVVDVEEHRAGQMFGEIVVLRQRQYAGQF